MEETTVSPDGTALTREEQDALDHAHALLETIPYSREGLISQMVYDGYEEMTAAAAADRLALDWKAQALKCAECTDRLCLHAKKIHKM
jgi:hypothetical protein